LAIAAQAAVLGLGTLIASAHADDASSAAWNKLLEAARKEGVVVVSGHPGELERKAVTIGWATAFPDIKLDEELIGERYTGGWRKGGPGGGASIGADLSISRKKNR
jgi:hypothetical protein